MVDDPYYARLRAGQSNPAVLAVLMEEPALVTRMTDLQVAVADAQYVPPAVEVVAAAAPGPHGPVPVRVYLPSAGGQGLRPLFVWVHGGGWVEGDLDMGEADHTAREVSERAGAVVVSVDYRLAGEGVHYPVPLDDVVAAWRWSLQSAAAWRADPARAVLGGASAGGNLAAGAALRLQDEGGPDPMALALVYPALHAELPMLDDDQRRQVALSPAAEQHFRQGLLLMLENYLGAPVSEAPAYVVPAHGDLSRLPPTLVMTCAWDVLRSSGETFAQELAVVGVPHRLVVVPDADHAHLNHGWMPQAQQSYQDLADWLTEGPDLATRTGSAPSMQA